MSTTTSPTSKRIVVRGACPHDCPDTCATITEVQRWARRHASTPTLITRSRRAGSAPRCGPISSMSITPTGSVPAAPRRTEGRRAMGAHHLGRGHRRDRHRWKAIIAEYGAAAILPYSYSGTLGLLQNGRQQRAALEPHGRQRAGALDLRRGGRGGGHERRSARAGRPTPPISLHSKLVLIWGHNPASTGPHFMPVLREAQRRGAYVVVIDPRRTHGRALGRSAHPPRPATDGALALGMMHVLFAEGLHDEAWLEAQHHWLARAARPRGGVSARACGRDHRPAATRPSSIWRAAMARPSRRCSSSPTACSATATAARRRGRSACLPAVVGQIGVRGGGLFYSTGDYGALGRRGAGPRQRVPADAARRQHEPASARR